MSRLCESVDYHPYGIISLRGFRESCHKIHGNIAPLPFGNLQGHEKSWRFLVLSFDLLAYQAFLYEFNYIILHSFPSKIWSQILIHFGCSGMYCVRVQWASVMICSLSSNSESIHIWLSVLSKPLTMVKSWVSPPLHHFNILSCLIILLLCFLDFIIKIEIGIDLIYLTDPRRGFLYLNFYLHIY